MTAESENPSPTPPDSPAPPDSVSAAASRRFGVGQALLVLVAVAALAALFWPRAAARLAPSPGGFVIDSAGHPQPLAQQFRDVSLVHLWATWCPPCRTEIPSLLAWERAHRSDRLAVILVAVADDPAVATRFAGPTDLPLLYDPSWGVAHRFGTYQLPETHIVVDGKIVDSFIGAVDWADPAVEARVQKWTARPASPTP